MKNGTKTACGKFISIWMETSLNFNCGTCKAIEKRREKALSDNIYVTINGDTFKLNTKNLKKISPRMIGMEYKVHKMHNGTFMTYLELSLRYPHLTDRKRSIEWKSYN